METAHDRAVFTWVFKSNLHCYATRLAEKVKPIVTYSRQLPVFQVFIGSLDRLCPLWLATEITFGFALTTPSKPFLSCFLPVCFKWSPSAQPSIWKWLWKWVSFQDNEHARENSFPYERLSNKTRFETEVKQLGHWQTDNCSWLSLYSHFY